MSYVITIEVDVPERVAEDFYLHNNTDDAADGAAKLVQRTLDAAGLSDSTIVSIGLPY